MVTRFVVIPLKLQKLPKFDKGYGSILGSGWGAGEGGEGGGGGKGRDEGKHGKETRVRYGELY